MKLNTNQLVKLNLTDSGLDVYQAYLDQFLHVPSVAKEATREVTLPLWEFAQIFGPVMYNGQPAAPFFVGNEIEII